MRTVPPLAYALVVIALTAVFWWFFIGMYKTPLMSEAVFVREVDHEDIPVQVHFAFEPARNEGKPFRIWLESPRGSGAKNPEPIGWQGMETILTNSNKYGYDTFFATVDARGNFYQVIFEDIQPLEAFLADAREANLENRTVAPIVLDGFLDLGYIPQKAMLAVYRQKGSKALLAKLEVSDRLLFSFDISGEMMKAILADGVHRLNPLEKDGRSYHILTDKEPLLEIVQKYSEP